MELENAYDEIKIAFDKARKRSEDRQYVYGIMGKVSTSGTVVISVPNRPKFVYVRIGAPGAYQVTTAKNVGQVALRANQPVRMTREGNTLVIRDTQTSTSEAGFADDTEIASGVQVHTHKLGSGLEYTIESLRLEPGLMVPISAYQVGVNSFRYKFQRDWVTFPYTTHNLAIDNVPLTTGKWRWVLLTVDPTTNGLVDFNGTEENYATPLTVSMLDAIDIGNNIPVGAIKLRADDENVLDLTKYYDPRQWITGNESYLDDLQDVILVSPSGGQSLVYDVDGHWENRTLDHLYISDWNEAVDDRVGALVVDSSTIDATYNDAGGIETLDVIPSGIDHGALGGLTDYNDHPGYLMIDGSRASATNPQVFEINTQAPFYDREMIDVNGDHFTTPSANYPVGWTDTTPASTGTFVSDGWWVITNIHTTGWTYRKESDYSADIPPYAADNLGILFGPIQLTDVYLDDDLTYYFGYYRDSAGIDLNTFNRIAVNWDNTLKKWQVRQETKNGTTQTNGYWYPLSFPPLTQNLWLRVTMDDFTGHGKCYIGTDQNPISHSLLGNIDMAGMGSWGDGWIQIHSVRTNVNLGIDKLLIGGVDYTTYDIASSHVPAAPPVLSVYGHTHPSTDITDFTEAVQDVMGGILIDGGMIDWTYNDPSNLLSLTIIDAGVTNLKLADMVQATVKGRASGAGTGQPQDLTGAQLATILGSSLTSASISDFTEAVQDVMGAILLDVTDIDWTYNDGANTISLAIAADAITNTKMANMAQTTVKGRAVGAGTGDPTDLTATQLNAIVGSADLGIGISPTRKLQVHGTIYVSAASASFTTSGWNKNTEMLEGSVLQWLKNGASISRAIGFTSDGNLYFIRSTASDNSAAATYDMILSAAGLLTVTGGIKTLGNLQIEGSQPLNVFYDASSNLRSYYGMAGSANAVINGSAQYDTVLRTVNQAFLLSTDNGSTPAVYVDTVGKIGFGFAPSYALHGRGKTNTGHNYAILEASGVAGSSVALIADAANDVTKRIVYTYFVEVSDGNTASGHTAQVNAGGSAIMYLSGANQLESTVNANGSFTVVRTGGSLTYKVTCWAIWF